MWLPKIGCLHLLPRLFPSGIVIPGAVHTEVVLQGGTRPGVHEVRTGLSQGWLKLHSELEEPERNMVDSLIQEQLDPGEAEAIALALRIEPDRLILDERLARKIAEQRGLNVIGTLGVLLHSKYRGWIPRVRPLVDKMQHLGFRISPRVYSEVLLLAGEPW